jgi:AraC family transcriptional regulator
MGVIVGLHAENFLAKIAVELQRALARRSADGTPGCTAAQMLAQGQGWHVADVICTSGPQDRAFEERHEQFAIAVVAVGSFQYRSAADWELMTPGSLLLGNAGQCFECGHEHGAGDRCISFHYSADYFERLAADAGLSGRPAFRVTRLPPLRASSPLVARVCNALAGAGSAPWEELSMQLAVHTLQLANECSASTRMNSSGAMAKVSQIVRAIEMLGGTGLALNDLAQQAALSPYHFLRVFEQLTGTTPHQYILRTRLREAALRLVQEPTKIVDIALDSGFGDLSNFNRAFRAEFGASPRIYRRQMHSLNNAP